MGAKRLFYPPELNPNIRVEMADSAKSVNTIGWSNLYIFHILSTS